MRIALFTSILGLILTMQMYTFTAELQEDQAVEIKKETLCASLLSIIRQCQIVLLVEVVFVVRNRHFL